MRNILIFYDYFLPAYKAGGPIQSIANICRHFKDEYKLYIICSNKDITADESLIGIKDNTWNDFENNTVKVFYLAKYQQTKKKIFELIEQVMPDVIFVNGLYSLVFTVYPLLYKGPKKIVSVRGMLHPGALSQKWLKKKIYFNVVKRIRLFKGVAFHVTDETEKMYTKKKFGAHHKIYIAQNFPRLFYNSDALPKQKGVLKLLSIALIGPMKNIDLVLKAIQYLDLQIQYDIYGPIKDARYWTRCLSVASNMSDTVTVNYKGDLSPIDVPSTLSEYHFFVLPSKSENFGHAIYEALAAGKPVITSHFTPWNNLETNKCGYNVDINNFKDLSTAVGKAAEMDEIEYADWSNASRQYLLDRIDFEKTKEAYRKMFG